MQGALRLAPPADTQVHRYSAARAWTIHNAVYLYSLYM